MPKLLLVCALCLFCSSIIYADATVECKLPYPAFPDIGWCGSFYNSICDIDLSIDYKAGVQFYLEGDTPAIFFGYRIPYITCESTTGQILAKPKSVSLWIRSTLYRLVMPNAVMGMTWLPVNSAYAQVPDNILYNNIEQYADVFFSPTACKLAAEVLRDFLYGSLNNTPLIYMYRVTIYNYYTTFQDVESRMMCQCEDDSTMLQCGAWQLDFFFRNGIHVLTKVQSVSLGCE
jgi:hypothetical protein